MVLTLVTTPTIKKPTTELIHDIIRRLSMVPATQIITTMPKTMEGNGTNIFKKDHIVLL